ncbi:MAG: LPXTG cell wall anchor domain-containing protein, partial [Clostridiales bacterium]|nr:LPXTG cell wall anchor domain-containing protein [Clostridiales bacterium]
MGTRAAEDVKVTLKGLKNGGFTTFNSTDVKYVAEIKGGSDSGVNYRLSVPTSETNAGNSDLTIKLDYTDEKGTAYNDESVIFLPYNGNGELVETGKPQLSCTITAQPQNAVSANRDFKVSMNLTNSGLAAAKNIKVTLSCDKEIVTKSLSTVSVDKIDKGTTKSLDFVMFATQDAITKNYPVAINIEYEDSKGTKFNASQYIGIYVENVASSSTKTVPRIIVSNYSMDPVDIKAGSDFKLTASFLNTSKKMAVSNIKVSISSDDGTFTPVDSGNAFFIEYIGIKESVEKSLMLHAKADAEQKSYVLTVNFDYEDEQGNPYTSKETISVPVLQNPRLVTGDFSLPAETMAGQPMQVYLDFYNMGKTTLNNLMIKAVGDFTGEGLSYYVGNFGSGSSESFDVSIIPNNVGELKGSVVFTYEDATGKQQSVSKDFSVNVIEMQMDPGIVDGGNVMVGPDGLPIGTQPETGLKKYLWYGVAGVVVIAGLVTFLIIRKKRKKRKEMLLDE